MTFKRIVKFLPALVALLVSVVTMIVYCTVLKANAATRIIQIWITPLIPLVIPLLNRIFKINIPFALNVFITIHAILALDFAAALNFYALIPKFDKFLHTFFGLLGSMAMFVLLLYLNGDKMRPFGFFLVIFLSVLGLAALWEVWEYTSDSLLGTICQGWQPGKASLSLTVEEYFKTRNPMNDTMWDIIVTAIGTVIFFLIILIDKFCGYRLCKSIYNQVHSGGKSAPETKEEQVD